MTSTNGISVIIPTLNRSNFVKNTLDCLSKQDFEHPFEVIIIDQSTTVDSFISEYAKKFDNVAYYYITEFRGVAEAKNFGCQKSKYDYLLIFDDDIEFESNLLTEHYKYINRSDIGAVAGGCTEKYKNNIDCKTGHFNYFTANPLRGFHQKGDFFVEHLPGGNFSIKKTAYIAARGIDENLSKGGAMYEETDFSLRLVALGYKIFYHYNAHVYHLAAPSGGNRIKNIKEYVFYRSRNATVVINRYLKWYHKPTAYLYLFKLALAYSVVHKKILIGTTLDGIRDGLTVGVSKCEYLGV